MQIKFVSVNVWEGGRLFSELMEFLRTQDADILALQEIHRGTDKRLSRQAHSYDGIAKSLGYAYKVFAAAIPRNENGVSYESGNAVYSRWPILESGTVFFDIPYQDDYVHSGPDYSRVPRNMLSCKIDLTSTPFNIFNVHGIWGWDGKDNARRLEMSRTILESIGDATPVVLCGDFNVDERTESVGMIGRKLNNVFAGERTTSFNMRRKGDVGSFGSAVVDHMFVSRDVAVLEHDMPDVDVSDHLPLTATFELATE